MCIYIYVHIYRYTDVFLFFSCPEPERSRQGTIIGRGGAMIKSLQSKSGACLVMYISVHIYIYIYIYIFLQIYIYIYFYLNIWTYVYKYIHIYICVNISSFFYLSICMYIPSNPELLAGDDHRARRGNDQVAPIQVWRTRQGHTKFHQYGVALLTRKRPSLRTPLGP